jgi:stage V sporulation protein AE
MTKTEIDMDIDFIDYLKAFVIGGGLCVIAQILLDKTKLTPARILVSYVVAGVILGAVGLYEPLAEFAGAGATTPLTGFGYVISKGIKEAVDKEGALGILKGALTAAAGGITAALVFGYFAALVFKSKPKK